MREIPWTTPASLRIEPDDGGILPPTPTLGIAVRRYVELDKDRRRTAVITTDGDVAIGAGTPQRKFQGEEIEALVALLP